jgi:hypothetical protein
MPIIWNSRRGFSEEAVVRARLEQLELLLPGLVNLHRLKASDWSDILLIYTGYSKASFTTHLAASESGICILYSLPHAVCGTEIPALLSSFAGWQ